MTNIYNTIDPETLQDAVMGKLSATRIRQKVKDEPHEDASADNEALDRADEMDAAADAVLALPEIPVEGTGGELMPLEEGGRGVALAKQSPEMMSIEASIQRADLANGAGVFCEALDTAQSMGAQDSAEKMLCHQLPTLHRLAMEMMTKAGAMSMTNTIEACRLANTAARLMDTYQKGMVAVKAYRRGGTQTIKHVHQYVQVQPGGQAVVTGEQTVSSAVRAGGGKDNTATSTRRREDRGTDEPGGEPKT